MGEVGVRRGEEGRNIHSGQVSWGVNDLGVNFHGGNFQGEIFRGAIFTEPLNTLARLGK